MKISLVLLLMCLISGCVSDVSNEFPHSKLIDTRWGLLTDAYVIEYKDNRGEFLIVPCVPLNSVRLPDGVWQYDEGNIGKENNSRKIIAGFSKGAILRVDRVMKRSHIEAGTSYYPILYSTVLDKKADEREFKGYLLYYGFYDKGILNPDYAEKVE